jgi:hypothetical protein
LPVIFDPKARCPKIAEFNKGHKAMLGHCKMILEDDRGMIAIDPDKFDKLITAQ